MAERALPKRTNLRIWKFRLETTDAQVVQMPFNAEVISAQIQRGYICLWAKGCSSEQVTMPRVFCIYGTDEPMFDVEQTHIGTVQDDGLVWHVFEVDPRSAPLFWVYVTMSELKRYIGDGVYADYDGFAVLLTTENGMRATNTISLEPTVLKGLIEFVAELGPNALELIAAALPVPPVEDEDTEVI